MNLKCMSKEVLLAETSRLVAEERRITTSILWHLFEIERRRLFAELGFGCLFDYVTQHLKYSAGSAHRRIAAMRLLRELPEIGEKIDSGALNVSSLSQAQTLFRQAKLENQALDREQKKAWIERLENKSHRECEKILAQMYPTQARPSSEKVIAPTRTEIRFEADDALYAKLKLLKARFAHKLKGSQDYKDLISLLADMAMEKTEPQVQKTQKLVPTLEPASNAEVKSTSKTSRYIPVRIKREAWEHAQGRCSYVHPTTGKRCDSQFALEYDHKIPLALGGKTERQNIRVLCRVHNGLAAIQSLGLQKMERYLTPQNERSHGFEMLQDPERG